MSHDPNATHDARQDAHPPAGSFWRRLILGLLATLGLLVLVGLWIVFADHGPGIPIGTETTFITEPVDEQGYVDYFAALSDTKPIDPKDNAAGPLLQVVMTEVQDSFPSDVFADLCASLEIASTPDPALELVDWFDFASEYPNPGELHRGQPLSNLENEFGEPDHDDIISAIYDRNLEQPWTAEQFPVFAAWVAANEKPLAHVAKGLQRPHYHFWPKRTEGIQLWVLPLTQQKRNISRALTCRALGHLGEGRPDLAADDVTRIHQLAARKNENHSLIEALVSNAIKAQALSLEIKLATYVTDRTQLQQRRAQIQDFGTINLLTEQSLNFERFMALQMIQEIDREARGLLPIGTSSFPTTLPAQVPDFIRRMEMRRFNAEVASKIVNARFNAKLNQIRGNQQPDKKEDAVAATEKLVSTLLSGNRPTAAVLTQFSVAFLDNMLDSQQRAKTKLALTDLAYAARLFEITHGRLAQSQADLVPEFLAQWPINHQSGARLAEHHHEDGRWTIYAQDPKNTPADKIPDHLRIDIPPMPPEESNLSE